MIVWTIGQEPLHREPRRDADHRLLHDPDVDGALRVVPEGSPELTGADLREHDRDAGILVEEIGGGLPRSLAHREAAHHSPSGMSATTAVGRTSSRAVSAASSAA